MNFISKSLITKIVTVAAALAVSATAHANLEIAAIAQMSNSSYAVSDLDGLDFKSGSNLRVGALLFLPLLPTLSLRTGYLMHNVKHDVSTVTYTDKQSEIPLNLQWNVPVTGLFIFGGITLTNTQSSECTIEGGTCTTDKAPNDNMVNAGLGYNLVSFGLFRWALEVETMRGTKDLVDGTGEVKRNALNLGTVFAVGF